jgi:hypothetical protein
MSLLAITYNSLAITDGSPYIIQKLGGVDGVEIRVSEANKTGLSGGNIFKQLYGMRVIWFEGLIFGNDAADFAANRRALIRAYTITANTDLVMDMWDGSSVKFLAKVTLQPQIEYGQENINFVPFRIELKCESPLILSTTTDSYQTGLAESGGFAIPTIIPISWTGGGSDTFVIDNAGDVEAYPSFRISGPVSNPTVINQTTGQSFQIAASLLSGEYVDIYRDSQGQWVVKSGGATWFQYLSGNLFKIEPGNNTIKFTASAYESEALLTAEFTNNYLSV